MTWDLVGELRQLSSDLNTADEPMLAIKLAHPKILWMASDEIVRLRELVQKQKELLLAVQCKGSVYCRDVKGVNWFDARDRLLQ